MKTTKLFSLFASLGLFAVTVSSAVAQDRVQNTSDHVGNYNFLLEIDGVEAGHFAAVDGLNTEVDVIEYQDGNDLQLRKRPGRTSFGNITLKRGYIINDAAQDLWIWVQTDFRRIPKRNLSIILQDPDTATEVMRWDLYECWPTEWKINGFDGKGNDVITEEITFAVEVIRPG